MANTYRFRPMKVCSQMITLAVDGDTLGNAQIYGGSGETPRAYARWRKTAPSKR